MEVIGEELFKVLKSGDLNNLGEWTSIPKLTMKAIWRRSYEWRPIDDYSEIKTKP